MTEVYVKVEPDSSEFKVETGHIPKFYLEEKAENGRANAELLDRLEEILGERPAIISGHRSGRKKLKIAVDEKQFREEIEEV